MGDRGWITPDGRVLEAKGSLSHLDVLGDEFALGNLSFKDLNDRRDQFELAFDNGYIRYWWAGISADPEGSPSGHVEIQGTTQALEDRKFEIIQTLNPQNIDVWVVDRSKSSAAWVPVNNIGKFTRDEFLEMENFRPSMALTFSRGRNPGKGWWGNRPGHKIAAKLGRFKRYG